MKVKQELEAQRKVYEKDMEVLRRDLEIKIDKVIKLEVQLDETRDSYRQLESSISREDLKFK
jgi:kinesin family member 5